MKKCELCGYELVDDPPTDAIFYYNGRILCYQCYTGEIENPEHALPLKED